VRRSGRCRVDSARRLMPSPKAGAVSEQRSELVVSLAIGKVAEEPAFVYACVVWIRGDVCWVGNDSPVRYNSSTHRKTTRGRSCPVSAQDGSCRRAKHVSVQRHSKSVSIHQPVCLTTPTTEPKKRTHVRSHRNPKAPSRHEPRHADMLRAPCAHVLDVAVERARRSGAPLHKSRTSFPSLRSARLMRSTSVQCGHFGAGGAPLLPARLWGELRRRSSRTRRSAAGVRPHARSSRAHHRL